MDDNDINQFGITLNNGVETFVSGWDAMAEYVKRGIASMVIVCASGEILFDARDGWDIVSDHNSNA